MGVKKCWQLKPLNGNAEFHVLETFPAVIGRARQCDIVIDDPGVSASHVQINESGKNLEIHDLNSSNGTILDGKHIKSAIVKQGQSARIQIGDIVFLLQFINLPTRKKEIKADIAWYYIHENQEIGPLTADEMLEAAVKGILSPMDDVWSTEGDTPKVKAYEVENLFAEDVVAQCRAAGNAGTDEQVSFSPEMIGKGAILCPYCWYKFNAEDALFISRHPELHGDPVLGEDAMQRFLPSRFTPAGHAIDAGGQICPDMACPRCHLRIPSPLLHLPPLIVSIVGAPSSGKSYFLASMCWRLRAVLPKYFSKRFMDIDAEHNRWINDYEEKLFLQANPDALQSIAKTEQQGNLYKQVTLGGMPTRLPIPCMFSLQSEKGFSRQEGLQELVGRSLIFYDNAGEHFQPGSDVPNEPGTLHLLNSEGTIFIFDPTMDPRFRKTTQKKDIQLTLSHVVQRQDTLLTEMMCRIRRYLGLRPTERYNKILIIALAKFDVLNPNESLPEELWGWDEASNAHCLYLSRIAELSYFTRNLIDQYAPEIVSTVESFADRVVYLPNSALGHSPEMADGADPLKPKLAIRPRDVKPKWVEIPLLYILSKSGYIHAIEDSADRDVEEATQYQVSDRLINLVVPKSAARLHVPIQYSGHVIRCPTSGIRFRVPKVDTEFRI